MRKMWDAIRGTLFWSYDRGSWPYDAMVVAILIFVLLTPRKWFNDQPQTSAANAAQIEAMIRLVAQDDAAGTRTYRLNANILPPNKRTQKPTPELEKETHEILGRTVEELKGKTFLVREINPVLGEDGGILYYDVSVKL